MKNNTKDYYSPKQGRLPLFITDFLDICDPVLTFDRIMEEIEIEKYLRPEPFCKFGRPGYNRVNMLKTVLFGFMDTGYASLRELEDRCRTNIRYMYLMDYETPSYRSFSYFINKEIRDSV
ncbi:transposase [Anaerotruncus rubiinfantis]|uniref:transposase n=2 Tax=Anaerotruncus rubiinfantis TaxID=1720200 RepID=UPI0034A225FE